MDPLSFNNSFYVYQAKDGTLTDSQLLDFVTTSVQTLRVGGSLYFATDIFMEGPEYILFREPIILPPIPEEPVEE